MLGNAQELVRKTVETYCKRYGISMFDIQDYDVERDWKLKNYPHENDCGCYVFYSDSNDRPLYIGVTLGALGTRISDYFAKNENQAMPTTGWKEPIRFIQTIRVHEAHEAPSLERYLITNCKPLHNADPNYTRSRLSER